MTKIKPKPFHAFALNLGYAEYAFLSDLMIYSEDRKFATAGEGLAALVKDLIHWGPVQKSQRKSETVLENLIVDLAQGTMQTHGRFLYDYHWNTNCWGEQNPIVRVCRAPQMAAKAFLGTLDKRDLECFFSVMTLTEAKVDIPLELATKRPK